MSADSRFPIELRRGIEGASGSTSLDLPDGRRVVVHHAEGETAPLLRFLKGVALLTVGNALFQFKPGEDAIGSTLQGQLFDTFDRGDTFVVVHEIGAAEFVKGETNPAWSLDTDILSDWKVEGDELVLKQWEDGAIVRKALKDASGPVEVDLPLPEVH